MSGKKERSSRSNKPKPKFVYLDKFQRNKEKTDRMLQRLEESQEIQTQVLRQFEKEFKFHLRVIWAFIAVLFLLLLVV